MPVCVLNSHLVRKPKSSIKEVVVERLSSLDASFLYIETEEAPLNVGTVSIFEPAEGGLDHEKLVNLIRRRLAFVPRYRQRVKDVPFGFFRPMWVDDTSFDVSFHVRRSALPKPGSPAQLDELVARLMSRPLDRSRPLWEMYLIEGLEQGRLAIVTKSHEALVDGLAALDISQVILDSQEHAPAGPPDSWRPHPEPSSIELVSASVTEVLTHPAAAAEMAVDTARDAVSGVHSIMTNAVTSSFEAASGLVSLARFGAKSPLKAKLGAQRRFSSVDLELESLRALKREAAEINIEASLNDVILTVVTGALRTWLMRHDAASALHERFRALVPVSMDDALTSSRLSEYVDLDSQGRNINAYLVDLPVGEFDPVDRLVSVTEQMAVLDPSNEFMGAGALVEIAGFGPATLHALGARVASTLSRRAYDITVTNVPGPQHALYAAGSRMIATYPCVPLVPGQVLSLGLTSYDGALHIGLMSDRDAVRDLDRISRGFEESLVGLTAALKQRRFRQGPQLRVVNS